MPPTDIPPSVAAFLFSQLQFDELISASQVCRNWRAVIVDNDHFFKQAAKRLNPLLLDEEIDRTDDRRICADRGIWYNCCIRFKIASRILNASRPLVVSLDTPKLAHKHVSTASIDIVDLELKIDNDRMSHVNPGISVGRSSGSIYVLHKRSKNEVFRATLDLYNGLYAASPLSEIEAPEELDIAQFKNTDQLYKSLELVNEDFYLGGKIIKVGNNRYTFRRLRHDDDKQVFLLEIRTTLKRVITANKMLPYVIIIIEGGAITHKYLMKTPVPPLPLNANRYDHYDFTMFSSNFYLTFRQDKISCYSLPTNELVNSIDVLPQTSSSIHPNIHGRRSYTIYAGTLLCLDEPSSTLYSIALYKQSPVKDNKWRRVLRFEGRKNDDRVEFFLSHWEATGRFVQMHARSGEFKEKIYMALLDMTTGKCTLYGAKVKDTAGDGVSSWVVDNNGSVLFISKEALRDACNDYRERKLSGPVPFTSILALTKD